ncbi:pectin lyase-like protein [Gloeophyllum trabeum ATCC 11539]|uniref:pectinesterase n=1 Tax=Gloeophyllum trabeum (strain ATCC 11539 / FP-39264 / Madison 617) TaxID=670483 RepID=S7RK74_GLOTA|nr:pectin lyase-like protein [Gloeophyllum trabeum ATCC 11539]EPQ54795.1 pectin lyase-like protein [Gloeophyllum trabeum ATCC 11539]
MALHWLYGVLALCCVNGVFGLSPIYLGCQLQKPSSWSQLLGCSSGTLYVSPTDPEANFTSVQAAVDSLSEGEPVTILIGEGVYHETVNVSRQAPLTLLGQLNGATAFDPAGNASTRNLVQIWNNGWVVTQGVEDDAQSAVLVVSPSFNASLIGAGPTGAPLQPLFGNVDFKAYNIDFQNLAANYSISQALVTDISYANASFYGCTFASYQDTWYTGRNASTYVVDSIIYGMTDYLFGFGTAWFQNVTLANRGCGGGLVAWKGTNLTDAPGNRYGAYISNSKIIRSPDANATTVTDGKCYLGRPWNSLATTVYLNTYMDQSIAPVGWIQFDSTRTLNISTTYYAEYNSYGPGGNYSGREPYEHFLTDTEARNFTVDKVFLEHPKWIDYTYIY